MIHSLSQQTREGTELPEQLENKGFHLCFVQAVSYSTIMDLVKGRQDGAPPPHPSGWKETIRPGSNFAQQEVL